MAPPSPIVVAGLDEEVLRRSEDAKVAAASKAPGADGLDRDGMADQLRSTLTLQNDDSSAASPSSSLGGGTGGGNADTQTWQNQAEWLKHESFVHRLERLLSDDGDDLIDEEEEDEEELGNSSPDCEDDDEEEEAQPTNEDARQRARQRKRKLLKLKKRYARRRSNTLPTAPASSSILNGEGGLHSALTPAALAAADTSTSELKIPTLAAHSSKAPSLPRQASSTSGSGEGGAADDDFYDAVASPETAIPQTTYHRASNNRSDEDDDELGMTENSWLNLSPRPNATASSATLRQDALQDSDGSSPGYNKDLHHQASTATLLGSIGEEVSRRRVSVASGSPSGGGRRRNSTMLPPAGPSPQSPLPPTPSEQRTQTQLQKPATPPTNQHSANSSASGSRSTSPVILGPNGTIRGRPRGATLPGGSSVHDGVRPQIRPRSLLSNEFSFKQYDVGGRRSGEASDIDSSRSRAAHAGLRRTAQHSPSPSSDGSGRRSSSKPSNTTGDMLSPAPLTSTPSSSAASIASSSAFSSSNSRPSYVANGSGARSRSGSATSVFLQHIQSRPRSHASFVIAVVGHKAAGKSTVIRKGLRQFGLSRPTTLSDRITSHSTVCIVDQQERTIEVLELDASILLSSGTSRRFTWPRSLPYIDAAILCYDASQISSFRGMSELLENFAMNNLSTVMLACKSELSPKAVDPYYASDMASVYNVGLAECSERSEEGKKRMRDCFSYLVKEVAKSRATTLRSGGGGSEEDTPPALSDTNGAGALSSEGAQASIRPAQYRRSDPSAVIRQETLALGDAGQTPGDAAAVMAAAAASTSEALHNVRQRRSSRNRSDVTVGSTEGGSEEESQSVSAKGGASLQQSINRAQLGLQSAKSAGGYVSLEELWDKLFFAAVSGNDERFLHMFMTFFRGFARPIELLRQIIARFDALARGEKSDGVMIRYSLMKLTTMLGDWMQDYPGDLSGAESYAMLSSFFERLLRHPATMHVAAPMQPLLDIVRTAVDLDAAWSKNQDNDRPTSVAADVPPVKRHETRGRASSTASAAAALNAAFSVDQSDSTTNGSHHSSNPEQGRERSASDATTGSSDGQRSLHLPGTPGEFSSSGGVAPGSSSLSLPAHSPQNQKQRLRQISNTLFEMRDEDIANELTRIEWDVFSTVGPRDLLRHILVSRASRALDSPVARSIAHFNYVSAWVCSLVVVQSKSKQRARVLEKFMEVATILRRTNNYNSLHAILAGLGNTAIHRLKHTRELLNGKRVMKQYQSLTRLMGSERSFAAYRLALENSQGRCIPYLGVHLQDILSTSDGNPSKRASDGMIHWRKFSLMYDAVMAIVRCQQYQIPLQTNPSLAQMILDAPVLDEDALYHRSLQVEPRQASATAASAGSNFIKHIFQT